MKYRIYLLLLALVNSTTIYSMLSCRARPIPKRTSICRQRYQVARYNAQRDSTTRLMLASHENKGPAFIFGSMFGSGVTFFGYGLQTALHHFPEGIAPMAVGSLAIYYAINRYNRLPSDESILDKPKQTADNKDQL